MSPIIQTTKTLQKRDRYDHYPTPRALCDAALGLLQGGAQPTWICDPGAGTGVWGAAARARWPAALIEGHEIRRLPEPADGSYNLWAAGADWLAGWDDGRDDARYDLICGNPPYRLAEDFVRCGLRQLEHSGTLLFLLPLGFLASQKRSRGLFDTDPPAAVHICASRPSFTGNNKTDATDYAIVVWQGWRPRRTALHWLDWKAEPAAAPDPDALTQTPLFG